jgi:acid phosphatase type 7
VTTPVNRRTAVRRLAGMVAAPIIAGCGVDRLLSPSLALSSAVGPIRLIGGGDPHVSAPTSWVPWKISDHINAMLGQDPAAYAFCLGDLVPNGTAQQLKDHYHPSWGRFKQRTLPAVGNHDVLHDPTGTPYYDYWNGMGVGARGKGYYHKLLGDHWLLVVLNSQHVRPEQTAWLKALLPLHPNRHIIAMCHYPFLTNPCLHNGVPSQMDWPSDAGIGQFVAVLQAAGCELYVAGHCHSYGRTPRVVRNTRNLREPIISESGMRQFVLGTGGVNTMTLTSIHRLMDANRTPGGRTISHVKGVFEFALYPDRYEWKFSEVANKISLGAVRDSGTQMCRKTVVAA